MCDVISNPRCHNLSCPFPSLVNIAINALQKPTPTTMKKSTSLPLCLNPQHPHLNILPRLNLRPIPNMTPQTRNGLTIRARKPRSLAIDNPGPIRRIARGRTRKQASDRLIGAFVAVVTRAGRTVVQLVVLGTAGIGMHVSGVEGPVSEVGACRHGDAVGLGVGPEAVGRDEVLLAAGDFDGLFLSEVSSGFGGF